MTKDDLQKMKDILPEIVDLINDNWDKLIEDRDGTYTLRVRGRVVEVFRNGRIRIDGIEYEEPPDTPDPPRFFKDEIVYCGDYDGFVRKASSTSPEKLDIKILAATMAGAVEWEPGDEPWASRDGESFSIWSGEPELGDDGNFSWGEVGCRVMYMSNRIVTDKPEKWKIQ